MKTLLKIDSRSRKANALRDEPLPLEMLPKMNRYCGKVGHKWAYTRTNKRCTRYLCEVTRPYTVNVEAKQLRTFE